MSTIQIVIERSKDMFSAYAENVAGIYGGGSTVEEAKQSVLDAIKWYTAYNKPENIPAILTTNFDIVYRFDAQSLLSYYKGIFTNGALERITGINQRQLQHYANGLKKPRKTQVKKIETGLHQLASELLTIQL